MELSAVISSTIALIFVLSLIGLVAFLFQKYSGRLNLNIPKTSKKRMLVKELLPLDAKKKLIIVSVDEKDFLISVSENNVSLIEKLDKNNNENKVN
jgi:flagellar biogenesis protein FliO